MIQTIELSDSNYNGGTYIYDLGHYIDATNRSLKLHSIRIKKECIDNTIIEFGLSYTDIAVDPEYIMCKGNKDVLCTLEPGLPELTDTNDGYYRWTSVEPIIKPLCQWITMKRQFHFYMREQFTVQRTELSITYTPFKVDSPFWIELEII
jgi:hypothetical protein